MINIFRQIREERDDFLNNEIEVVPGYTFSQYNTIKKIHLYYNGHYEKGDYEEVNGVIRKKVFHNITSEPCDIATKMIDLDVKDFTLVSNNPEQDLNVLILEKELKAWLKKNEMGQTLNEISRKLPIYGTCVLKKTAKGASLVDLRYLYNDQSADTLENGRYTIIKNFLSHQELRKMATKGWENIQKAIDSFSGKYHLGYDLNAVNTANNGSSLYFEGSGQQEQKNNVPLVEVFERYGQVPLSWFTDKEKDENEYVLAKYIVAGVDQITRNDSGAILSDDGLILFKEQIDELPFKEVHFQRTEGRFLGIGVVEKLFEVQRRMNELKNQESRAAELGSLQVFQSRDVTVASNVMTDLQNGDIIKVKSEITPIATESRDLSGFANMAVSLKQHADDITFSRDVVSGDTPPSGTTLGALQIQAAQTSAVFDYKKENIGLFLEDFINELVFPQIEKELNMEHTLRLVGSMDELMRLRKNFAMNMANSDMIEAVMTSDAEPTPELYQYLYDNNLANISKMGDKIWVKIWKNFFKNLDYYVDIVITGENRNVASQIQNSSQLLQVIGSNPALLQDPVSKKLLFKLMSNMGFHLSELEDMEANTETGNPLAQIQQQNQAQPQQKQPVPQQ